MMRPAIRVAVAYIALAIAAVAGSWLLPFSGGARMPEIHLQRDPSQNLDGWVPDGLWQIDAPRLGSSINRLSAVRVGREIGNSARLAFGQRVEWIIWGDTGPLMLFPKLDLWVSRGLTPSVEGEIDRAATNMASFGRQLAAEGWTLVVVPVPTKMAIHRERVAWPVQGESLTSRDLIPADRSEELNAFLQRKLSEKGVRSVDLQEKYRAALQQNPSLSLYATNDSHWAGEGIRIAAQATARRIASATSLRYRDPVNPTFLEVDHVGDLAKAFDPMPGVTTWLSPAWTFHDRLMSGEAGRGYVYADKPVGLVVVVGTSYTGQYTWLENQPVGFTWQLGLHMQDVEIQNRPASGQGSFFAFHEFWKQRQVIASEFESKRGQGLPKVLVWEFPVRDIKGIADSGG